MKNVLYSVKKTQAFHKTKTLCYTVLYIIELDFMKLWNLYKKQFFLACISLFLTGATIGTGLNFVSSPQEEVLGAQGNLSTRPVFINYQEASQASLTSIQQSVASPAANPMANQKEPGQILMNIPVIKQKYALSCEATAIQMALKYRGIHKTQEELMEDIGFALPIEPQQTSDMLIWGDPDSGFVGKYEGKYVVARDGELQGDGWGTHETPVLNAVQKYRAGSWAKKMATVEDLKKALEADMPVIFWYVQDNHDKEKLPYHAPNGQRVVFEQFHVMLLVGYQTLENGDILWIFNDPIYDRLEMNTEEMLKRWNDYDARMVAVG